MRSLSPLPLTELGRRCTASTRMPGRPGGWYRVHCDLPARHRGMHEHILDPGSTRVEYTDPGTGVDQITIPRQAYSWPPRLVALAWWVLDRTRRDV